MDALSGEWRHEKRWLLTWHCIECWEQFAVAMRARQALSWDKGYSKNGRWQCGLVSRDAEGKVLTGSWLGLMCGWKSIWKNPGSLGILVLTSVSCGICGEHFPGEKRSWPVTLNSVGEPQWWFSCKYTVNKAGLWVGVFVFIRENSEGYFL